MDKEQKQMSFEEALKTLEEQVKALEAEDLTLEEAMKTYQSGLEMVTYCNKAIDKIQQSIQVINEESDHV